MQHRFKIRTENIESAQALRLPKFCIKADFGLFDDGAFNYLEPENLLEGFRLTGQDANVNFKISFRQKCILLILRKAVKRYRNIIVTDSDKKILREYLDSLPQEKTDSNL